MRCCAPGCKNDSRYSSISQGITFHVFPNEPDLRALWLQVLGKKESWEPNHRSAICSEHFLCEDLYKTKSGHQQVRPGAVPLIVHAILDSSNCEYGEPAATKVCRICLVMNCKLFPITKYKLEQAYEHLTGVSPDTDARLPQKLCAECTQRLINFNRFRMKSLRANSLMTELLKKHGHLTLQNLQSINRVNNQLSLNSNTKYLYIDGDLPVIIPPEEIKTENDLRESDTDVDLPVIIPPEEIKTENDLRESDTGVESDTNVENDLEESDTNVENDFKESDTDVENDLKESDTDVENDLKESDTDVKNEENSKIFIIELDDDYVQIDDYSTHDSLPLKVAKSKKAKVKTKRKKAVKKDPEVPKIDRRRKPFLKDDLNETLFTITDLTIEEQIVDIEKRQKGSNYKNSVFKCTECYKGFKDEDAYNSHMLRHTTKCGDHRCPVCKTHFKHARALRMHVTAHHTQRFSCNQCSYTTTNRQAARLHESWHKGTMYKCPHCTDEFDKLSTYMGHIRIKHPSDFVCQLCGYSFVSEKGIMLHKSLKHRLENNTIPEDAPTCDLCNLRFMNTDALKRHIKVSARHNNIDTPDKPQQQGVRDRREKRNKRKRDVADGPIPCEQCGVLVPDWRAYFGHFRRMHPDMNRTIFPSIETTCMCEVCGRILQSYSHLKDHRWVHTGEFPFKCECCGKSFHMKQRLDNHRRKHSAPKTTYMCHICGKQFSTHANRQRHIYIHTGVKPFKCETCGKCFMHRCQRREHINYVHLKKPWPKRIRGKRLQDGRPAPA